MRATGCEQSHLLSGIRKQSRSRACSYYNKAPLGTTQGSKRKDLTPFRGQGPQGIPGPPINHCLLKTQTCQCGDQASNHWATLQPYVNHNNALLLPVLPCIAFLGNLICPSVSDSLIYLIILINDLGLSGLVSSPSHSAI